MPLDLPESVVLDITDQWRFSGVSDQGQPDLLQFGGTGLNESLDITFCVGLPDGLARRVVLNTRDSGFRFQNCIAHFLG